MVLLMDKFTVEYMCSAQGTAFQAADCVCSFRGLKPPVIEVQASSLTNMKSGQLGWQTSFACFRCFILKSE